LYVAMTRAADRLIVGGRQPGNRTGILPHCWYDLIAKGLSRSGLHEQTILTPDGTVRRFVRPEDAGRATAAAALATGSAAACELPQWLRTNQASRPRLDNPVRPSAARPAAPGTRAGRSGLARTRAILRGTLVHRLLQSLPEVPAERRAEAARAYLARNAPASRADERETLAREVIALIEDRRFAGVFSATSRAEVGIVGRLATAGRPLVSGQIDRLVVKKREVLIVDFKTNHDPPTDPADAPEAYVRQLALYRAVLGMLYPQRSIRAALLWTEAPRLMEISAPALDAALASFVRGGTALDPAGRRS